MRYLFLEWLHQVANQWLIVSDSKGNLVGNYVWLSALYQQYCSAKLCKVQIYAKHTSLWINSGCPCMSRGWCITKVGARPHRPRPCSGFIGSGRSLPGYNILTPSKPEIHSSLFRSFRYSKPKFTQVYSDFQSMISARMGDSVVNAFPNLCEIPLLSLHITGWVPKS